MSEQSTLVYKLIHPIESLSDGGQDITEIEFKKPTLGRLKKYDPGPNTGENERVQKLLCAGCKYPPAILDRLEWDDYRAMQEEVMDFLGIQNG